MAWQVPTRQHPIRHPGSDEDWRRHSLIGLHPISSTGCLYVRIIPSSPLVHLRVDGPLHSVLQIPYFQDSHSVGKGSGAPGGSVLRQTLACSGLCGYQRPSLGLLQEKKQRNYNSLAQCQTYHKPKFLSILSVSPL